MKAIGYTQSLPAVQQDALVDIELPQPTAQGRDILVQIEAVAVNPVDTKIRQRVQPNSGEYQVLGWDAVGKVVAVGELVTLFQPGDRVWYAGAIDRAGCNAQYHLVDERIVALAPQSLSDEQAAALPLTSITAWELLFDRLSLQAESTGTLLVIGAAGGVGSILIQLAKQLTGLTVIGTASREETQRWVAEQGADIVINHQQPMPAQLVEQGVTHADYVISLTHTDSHLSAILEMIAPQGKLALIDDPKTLDIIPFKRKSVSIHWELMFTRSLYQTDDMIKQHQLLTQVAQMVDAGQLHSTLASHFGTINAANLRKAHQLLESGTAKGKIVLRGF